MPKHILIFPVILLVLIVVSFFITQKAPLKNTTIKIKDKNYDLELAKTLTQKAKGLGDRTSLCSNCGMVFVFGSDGIQSFWMKDTLIPLDMIWVNSQGRVVYIVTANPEPGVPDSQLKIYQNTDPAKYVIELNAGESQKLGLKPGDSIDLSNINNG